MGHTSINLDKNFRLFLENNDIDMAIYMDFSLPYYLIINSGFFEFLTSEDFILPSTKRKRRVTFKLSSYAHHNQEVPLREATLSITPNDLSHNSFRYTVINTYISILVETFNDEKEMIKDLFENKPHSLVDEIMQPCLEYILFKYNEYTHGKHAISPSVYDCSHLMYCFLYSNQLVENFVLTPNTSNLGQIKSDEFINAIKEEVKVWKAFYSESKYSCKTYDFKKAIIYSSVSLESYINYIILSNDLNPSQYEKNAEGNFLTVYAKVSKLVNKGFIQTNYNYKTRNRKINNILDARNDIMHGKLRNFDNLKNKAVKSVRSLEELLNDWGAF
ncbi:hypothetical protein E3U55_09980 [Filobacillus milosensis]|uniref:Uncharacterized protein n=1 Tax=Filobacillus milosensis TaxID=94137 RepID=A0A4Y8IK01_9BACI|nr:hypothetical protein [Filobacillus milosensis]TFB21137.1 hypothetical protein E3U55_09980 [Filobacillus milosensis]